jgi:putative glutamine amidotransferase
MTFNELIIGISGSKTTPSIRAMSDQIRRLGATPDLLVRHRVESAHKDIARIHALALMGNDFDIDPHRYIYRYPSDDPRRRIHPATKSESSTPESAARAAYEEVILAEALKRQMPVLGICGGMQRINIMCGGTLHQHVPDLAGTDKHAQHTRGIEPHVAVVPILVVKGTILSQISTGIRMPFIASQSATLPTVVTENSMHHQAIDMVAPNLVTSALSDAFPRPDGTADYMIEAIESDPAGRYGTQFLLGVQWHPEFGASDLGPRIVQRLVKEADIFAGHSAIGNHHRQSAIDHCHQ